MDTIGPEGRKADRYDQCHSTMYRLQSRDIDDSKAYLSSLVNSNTQDLYMSYWGAEDKEYNIFKITYRVVFGNTNPTPQSSTILV